MNPGGNDDARSRIVACEADDPGHDVVAGGRVHLVQTVEQNQRLIGAKILVKLHAGQAAGLAFAFFKVVKKVAVASFGTGAPQLNEERQWQDRFLGPAKSQVFQECRFS